MQERERDGRELKREKEGVRAKEKRALKKKRFGRSEIEINRLNLLKGSS